LHNHLLERLCVDALPLVVTKDLDRVLVVRNLINFDVLVIVATVVLFLEAELFDTVAVDLELFVAEFINTGVEVEDTLVWSLQVKNGTSCLFIVGNRLVG
jgi:hypothetical protein